MPFSFLQSATPENLVSVKLGPAQAIVEVPIFPYFSMYCTDPKRCVGICSQRTRGKVNYDLLYNFQPHQL